MQDGNKASKPTDQSEKPRRPHWIAYGNGRQMLAHVETQKKIKKHTLSYAPV